jgi:DGQHR domain-containing protein
LLDRDRAQEIATYIDAGLGTIPTSIVLSAQESANISYNRPKKTLEFDDTPSAFLILDGQHRVYGFSLAKAALRVPVVVYTGLSRRDESRIFIDINTKQRPVPNELLLDIKKLAEYETDVESQLSKLFDMFADEAQSPLKGMMSPMERREGKLSRVTFNAALKSQLPTFSGTSPENAFRFLSGYIGAHLECLRRMRATASLTRPAFFKAIFRLLPSVAQRVKDKHGSDYSVDHFLEVLEPAYSRIPASKIKSPGQSVQLVAEMFQRALTTGFSL